LLVHGRPHERNQQFTGGWASPAKANCEATAILLTMRRGLLDTTVSVC